MLADIADASRSVRFEQESEYLPYKIGISPTLGHIPGAFGTSAETMSIDTSPNLAPSRLFIIMATGTFLRQILSARAAIEATRRYEFFISFDILHISNAPQPDDTGYYNIKTRIGKCQPRHKFTK